MSAELIEQLILVTHLLLALAIIGLIMLQQGKGADMGASFGAGASQTLFGSSGSGNVLTRTTAWLAALFFASSFGLAVIAKNKTVSSSDFDIPLPESVDMMDDSDLPDAAPLGDVPALDPSSRVEDDLPGAGAASVDEIPELPQGAGEDPGQ
jgi:preprotein translocase subunit SecG